MVKDQIGLQNESQLKAIVTVIALYYSCRRKNIKRMLFNKNFTPKKLH